MIPLPSNDDDLSSGYSSLDREYLEQQSSDYLTHARLLIWVGELVRIHRAMIGILPRWTITPLVYCPEDLEGRNAVMTWRPDTWEAFLSIRCDLPSYEHVRWEVVHELFELHWASTGTLVHSLIHDILPSFSSPSLSSLFPYWMEQYRTARNQEIEAAVSLYLHKERPVWYPSAPLAHDENAWREDTQEAQSA